MEQSKSAGCVFCGATFAPAEIQEWIAERDPITGREAAETAKCPKCGTDSVLPSAAPVMLNARVLSAMQAYLFKGAH
jgi:hypothetical protein